MSDDFPNRQSIRLKDYDYSCNGLYFVTVCTKNHDNLLGEVVNGKMSLNEIGLIVKNEIITTAKIRTNIEVDQYIIMPNHIHIIIKIADSHRRGAPLARPTHEQQYTISSNTNDILTLDQSSVSCPVAVPTEIIKPVLKANSIGAIVLQIKSISTKKSKFLNGISDIGKLSGVPPARPYNGNAIIMNILFVMKNRIK